MWALLVTYQALTRLAFDAAAKAGTATARISFSVTLRSARDSIPGHVARTPVTLSRAYARAVVDIAGQQLAIRRSRSHPRKVKPPQHKYDHLRRGERRTPGTVDRTLQVHTKTRTGPRSPQLTGIDDGMGKFAPAMAPLPAHGSGFASGARSCSTVRTSPLQRSASCHAVCVGRGGQQLKFEASRARSGWLQVATKTDASGPAPWVGCTGA